MCFSASASFTLAAVLLPAGVYCAWSAFRKDKALLGLAVVPFAFSAQQFSEGLVWRGIGGGESDHPDATRIAAFVFLYFALSFWPVWIPLCAFLTEHDRRKKWLLACFACLGFAGGLFLYLPVLLEPQLMILSVWNRSIMYDITGTVAFRTMPILAWQVLYAAVVGVPTLLSPTRGFAVFGVALLLSALVSHVLYWHTFISMWCFFAATLSLYLCMSFRRLPLPT
jgi:hypothetical protein